MYPEPKKTIVELLSEELKKQEDIYVVDLEKGKELPDLKLIRDKIKKLRMVLKNLKNEMTHDALKDIK